MAIACDEGIILRGDSDKLARVFNNILKNAAVYTVHSDEQATVFTVTIP